MPTLTISIQSVLEDLPRTTKQEKKEKVSKLREKKQNYLFADDMILYIGNPKDPTKKLLELI